MMPNAPFFLVGKTSLVVRVLRESQFNDTEGGKMKWFYNMKISSKLVCVAVLLALFAGVVGYEGITELNKLSKANMDMYSQSLLSISILSENAKLLQMPRVSIRDAFLDENLEKTIKTGREQIKVVADNLKAYEPRVSSAEERKEYDAVMSFIGKYTEYYEQYVQIVRDKKKRTEALAYMRGPLRTVATGSRNSLDKMSEMKRAEAKAAMDSDTAAAKKSTRIMLAIIGIGMSLAIVLGLWLARIISRPIKQVAERAETLQRICITNLGKASDAMAHGDLDVKIVTATQPLDIDTKDEVGALARSVNGIIAQTQSTVASFEAAMANLRKVTNEINELIQSAQEGNLGNRGKAQNFEGGYRQMVEGFNSTLDAVVGPLQMASGYIQRISKGDIPPTIVENYKGDFNDIKNSLNLCIESLRNLIEEDGGAALLAAANKDLTARVRRDYEGAFGKMKSNINLLIQNLDQALLQVSLAADQVAAASGEISSGSQTLSQGASEQASSLEEVSSSLQEMASMTRRNAENAKEARSLSDSALSTADKGVESMKRLSSAIDRIKASSDSTAKIVKTIDEIAFQTNLLALNAAVEAARAGDAGKGFAVVAEEVRNLAMRSAEAAKNTSNMIEESVKNAEGGVSINREVLENLTEINSQVNRVNAVMAEIAAASEQQSQGVDQVSTAVEQMNQVTQQVAANAEESASAAEELSGQSEEMKSMVAAFQISQNGMGRSGSSRRLRQDVVAMNNAWGTPKSVKDNPGKKANGSMTGHMDPSMSAFDGGEQSILEDF